MALANDLSRSKERYGRVRAAHDVLHSDYTTLREDYERLQAEHQTLQAQVKQREIDHVAVMQDQGTGGTGTGDSVNPSSLEGYTLVSGSSVSGSAEGSTTPTS
nr:hypothetical protein Iba_chr06aCG16140 [Ipomoea batatas]